MANRNQNNQWDTRRSSGSQGGYGQGGYGSGSDRSQDNDESRYSRGPERDSGRYGSNEDRGTYGNENYSGYGTFGQGDYDQRGGYDQPNYGRASQGEEYGSSGTSQYGRSNFGSGRNDSGSSGSSRQQGWSQPSGEGRHRGKGPKGFQRSDERVKELICERLSEDPHVDATEITVNVQGGKVVLEGSVDSRQTKNAAEDIAEQYCQDVQNNLRVIRQGQGESQSGSSARGATGSAGKMSAGNDESDGSSKQKRN
jgi:osmotically-inducible protein OsmY